MVAGDDLKVKNVVMSKSEFQTQRQYPLTTDEEQETLNEITNTLETYAKELLVDLILGNKSLDDLATYQAELEKLG